MRFVKIIFLAGFLVGCAGSPAKDVPDTRSGLLQDSSGKITMYVFSADKNNKNNGYYVKFNRTK